MFKLQYSVAIRVMALVLGLFAGAVQADPPPKYNFLVYDDGLAQAKKSRKPVFVYFGRYGCAWCDKTNRETFSDAKLRKLYSDHYVLVYVDTESNKRLTLPTGERLTEAELGHHYKIFATPLFVFLDPAGNTLLKVPGFKTVADFRDYDRYIIGGHYKTQPLLKFLEKSRS